MLLLSLNHHFIVGNLVDDFIFDQGTGPLASRMLHVRNAPSPACTASLAIAEMVVDEIEEKLLHTEKQTN